MLVWRFATRAQANACVAAIDAQLGANEDVELGGRRMSRARRTWAVPFTQVSTGQFCVPVRPRMQHLAGRPGIPSLASAVTIPDDDRNG